jgi:hypothetical protein
VPWAGGGVALAASTIGPGGERGLVSLPVFKTGAPGDPRWAGSIPVRLRYRSGVPPCPEPSHPPAAARLFAGFDSRPPPLPLRRPAMPGAISPAGHSWG